MAKAAAIILTGIAIALLVVYGADVAAGVNVAVSYTHLTLPTSDLV